VGLLCRRTEQILSFSCTERNLLEWAPNIMQLISQCEPYTLHNVLPEFHHSTLHWPPAGVPSPSSLCVQPIYAVCFTHRCSHNTFRFGVVRSPWPGGDRGRCAGVAAREQTAPQFFTTPLQPQHSLRTSEAQSHDIQQQAARYGYTCSVAASWRCVYRPFMCTPTAQHL
jgi:hypothetical protein